MIEKDIEKFLCTEVKKRGGLCLKFVSPSYSGVPDRLVLLNGEIFFIELKQPKEKERARQVYVQDKMRKQGAIVYNTVDSKERVLEILDTHNHERS